MSEKRRMVDKMKGTMRRRIGREGLPSITVAAGTELRYVADGKSSQVIQLAEVQDTI